MSSTAPPPPFLYLSQNFRRYAADLARDGADDGEDEILAMLLPTVRGFANAHLDARRIDKDKGVPRATLTAAAELGLFGLTVPTTYGGAGLSLKAACRALEEIATFDSSFSTTMGLHNGLGLRALVRFGSKELKLRYLPDLAAGRKIGAFSATEADAGSDISSVKTQAVSDPRTGKLTINGTKVYVTNGALADVYTALVSSIDPSGEKKGLSLVLIPRQTPGVTVGAEEDKLGIRGSSTTSVYFDNVVIDADHVIGTPGQALGYFQDVLAWGRTLMSAGALGVARRTYAKALEHVQTRRQFGVPLASFGLVHEKVSRMAQQLFLMNSLIRMVGVAQGHGRDISFESSVCKILCSEGAGFVCDESVQLHGGAGFIEETGIPLAARDARICRIFEGTNEMLRLHSAYQLLAWKSAELEALPAPAQVHPLLVAAFDRALSGRTAYLHVAQVLRKRHKLGIINEQHALKLLTEAAMAWYAMTAVTTFAQSLLDYRSDAADHAARTAALCNAVTIETSSRLDGLRRLVDEPLPYRHADLAEAEYRHHLSADGTVMP